MQFLKKITLINDPLILAPLITVYHTFNVIIQISLGQMHNTSFYPGSYIFVIFFIGAIALTILVPKSFTKREEES